MAQDLNDNVTLQLPGIKGTKLSSPVATEFTMHEPPAQVCTQLATILSWPRKHDTAPERAFCEWIVSEIRLLGLKPTIRALGCITVEVPRPDGKNGTTLFAAHVDTVDCVVTDVGARKKISYDSNFGHIFLDKDNTVGSCLGADDGVGVWMLLSMIKAKVPGGYVFTRGEECGGLGANAMVSQDKAWLGKFDACVEFDRPRYDEIITHQRGGTKCASDKFGEALAKSINTHDPNFSYKTSTKGVYTDNYAWRGIIAECVNVGVGYDRQHGPSEVLDYGHADALRKVCELVPWEALPIDRDPKEPDPVQHWAGSRGYAGLYAGKHWGADDWDDDRYGTTTGGKWTSKTGSGPADKKSKAPPPTPINKNKPANTPTFEPKVEHLEDEVFLSSAFDWVDFCQATPEDASLLIIDLANDLRAMRSKYAALRDLLAQSLN